MNLNYQGEHLGYGQLGNILIILSFTAALLSCFAYYFSFKRKNEITTSWVTLGRMAFSVHAMSALGLIFLIYYLIHGHFFEYYYVWQHSSTILPFKYMWACLWEGQEGSFLVWTFWHVILSFVIILKAGKWEAPVMFTLMIIQAFLASMLLGLEFDGIKIGSNPFILLRDHPDFANLPFIQMPDYLSKIKDGRGLNPLLQNYWMVIHPPTLFLGFAATAIPFAYAIGGMLTGKVKEWVAPAMPWAFFGVMILGTGLLMGGAWAYESLSFGGFWAWDPVENASLVPWLTLVGAAHVMVIFKKNGTSLGSTIVLVVSSFLLILYSTFLTRSGILGDTSVHAFTDLGMRGQLVLYMLFFVVLSIVLVFINRKEIKGSSEDDHISSREFWMFMGMLILVISAVQISITTSIPVINKIFGTKMAPPADAIDFYNSWQIPIAVIIGLLLAISQFFKWKQSDPKETIKKLVISFVVALIAAITLEIYYDFDRVQQTLLLFTALWAFLANLDYLIRVVKGKTMHSGSSIAHMGIALILLGSLISNAEKTVISQNRLKVDLGKDFPNNENILLYQGDTLPMGEFYVTYKDKKKEGINIFYEVEYFKANHLNGKLEKSFSLFPKVQLNERMGNVSEPSTKHYLNRDIYTHVTYAELDDKTGRQEDGTYRKGKKYQMSIGDTITTSNSLVILESLNKDVDKNALMLKEGDIAIGARLLIMDVNRKIHYAEPVFVIRENSFFNRTAEINELGLKFAFEKILPEENKMEIDIAEKEGNVREFVIMKAIIFPQINILWTGCILMIIGTWIAIVKRIRQLKAQQVQ
ncbi:MAG: cytochrome c biogenesis protein CcsA [Bacteroidetes bacterium]|nr:cytochrome c biogenesis protein CcsA [Bacteroidota bacterium]